MRILTVQRGCMDYESFRKVNGKVQTDFKETCTALVLLDDDRVDNAIIEASDQLSSSNWNALFDANPIDSRVCNSRIF